MREGSAPNFCPPVEEGMAFTFEDEKGDKLTLEFLGLIIHEERRYGFFLPLSDDIQVGEDGQLILLEVVDLDEEGQPAGFELVLDEDIAKEVYEDFREATKDLYQFA